MRKLFVGLFLSIGIIAYSPLTVMAVSPMTQVGVCTSSAISNIFGFQPWYACLPKDPSGNPKIEQLTDIFKIIFPVVDSLAKASVLVAASFMFFMLFKIVFARGDTGQIGTALNGIRDAGIGLIIAMVAVGIVNFISGAF